jgi:hypothetical protein
VAQRIGNAFKYVATRGGRTSRTPVALSEFCRLKRLSTGVSGVSLATHPFCFVGHARAAREADEVEGSASRPMVLIL